MYKDGPKTKNARDVFQNRSQFDSSSEDKEDIISVISDIRNKGEMTVKTRSFSWKCNLVSALSFLFVTIQNPWCIFGKLVT